ncbi:aminoacyltransferase [Marichromatium bheemlicum]|uniref:Aminoacyltransferase n=1 Tax=Marichromatium bheemlicum TaxID=365339 RepID=A0ABX1I7L0_9GAMM|nr:aminoacyltransferase [Marichromatium bheemlicum]NKN33562.1 aminoacyltransferase [Marichromatium bheemlicum]
MSALEIGGLILSIEFALVAWGVLFFMLRRQRQGTKQAQADASAVLEQVDTSEEARREALAGVFAATYQLEGDELQSTVDEYLERERAFYNAMLDIYLERSGEKLQDLPKELTKVLAPLVHMTPTNMIDIEQLSDLEDAKAQLEAELGDTKKTLNQLMDEYNAAFSAQQQEAAAAAAAPAPEASTEPEDADVIDDIDALLAEAGANVEPAAPDPTPEPEAPAETAADPEADAPASPEADEPRRFELADEIDVEEEAQTLDEDDEEIWQEKLEELSDLFETPEDEDKGGKG